MYISGKGSFVDALPLSNRARAVLGVKAVSRALWEGVRSKGKIVLLVC